jgi:hypothetical protein
MSFDAADFSLPPQQPITMEQVVTAAQVHADATLAAHIARSEKTEALKKRIAPKSVDPGPVGPGFEQAAEPPAKKLKVSTMTKSSLIIKLQNIVINKYITDAPCDWVIDEILELVEEVEKS